MDWEYLENYVWIYAHATLQLWQVKTQFGDGLINFNNLVLKTVRLGTLQGSGSNLSHLKTLDGKNKILKMSSVK